MDWNTLLIATIPAVFTAIVSGFISYISASKTAKTELDKAKVDQETALKKIESDQQIAIQSIEKNAENEIKKMRTATLEEIELYKAKSQTDMEIAEKQMTMEQAMPFAGAIFGNLFNGEKSVEEVSKTMKELQDFSDSLKK